MIIIAAADKNWGIGKDGNLLDSIKEDMKFFRSKTTDNVVIMGRKTLESFPGKKPLKNRVNIVITNNSSYKVDDAIVVNSVEDAVKEANNYSDKDVYVIGGGTIYEQMLKYCNLAYITHIDKVYEADTFIYNFEASKDFELIEESEVKSQDDLAFTFRTYKRVK